MVGGQRRERCTALSIVVTGDEPPHEFRIFTAGDVVTTKGTFTFDDAAAASVMAEYAAHGIELMIDYDHASLASVTLDPALAGKAAGWFTPELRNGELWAVNVRWCPPAAEALRRKEWRFMSPAFATDDGRVTSLLNVAITNLPATRQLEPLMAASVTALGENGMSVDEFLAVCKALDIDMSGPLEDAMAKIKGEPKAEEKKEEPKEEPKPEPAAELAAPEGEKPEEIAAALSAVASLSGKPSLVASVADIRTWHTSHVELAARDEALAKREALLEGAERRKLCVELVTLAGRAPATVWASEAKESAPKPYLMSMPIADLRAMHADEVKANAGRPVVKPPVAAGGVEALSARELAMCAEMKIDPKDYAARKPVKKG